MRKSEKRRGRKRLCSGLKNIAAPSAGDRQETQHSLRALRDILPNILPVCIARNKRHKYRQADTKGSKKPRLSRLHNSRYLFTDLKPVESSSHPDAIIVTSLQRLLSCPPFNTWRPFLRDFRNSVCYLFRPALPDQTISIISNERHY